MHNAHTVLWPIVQLIHN